MTAAPPPFTSPDAELRDFPFMPIDVTRLLESEFNAITDDTAWRVGLTLWLKSWQQEPAGSLPNSDASLCKLADLGRDLETWKRVKAVAMRHWVLCSDGLLYHPVVAEKVNEAWQGKLKQRWGAECGRIRKDAQRKKLEGVETPTFDEWLNREGLRQAPVSSGTSGIRPKRQRAGNNHTVAPDSAERPTGQTPVSHEKSPPSKRERERESERDSDSEILLSNTTIAGGAPVKQVVISPGERSQAGEVYARVEALLKAPHPLGMLEIRDWLRLGLTADTIVAVIEDVLAKTRHQQKDPAFCPSTMRYFDKAMRRRVAEQGADGPSATQPETPEDRRKLLETFAGFVKSGRRIQSITDADLQEMRKLGLIDDAELAKAKAA